MKKFFIFAILLLTSACGFEPLYAQKKPQTSGFYFSGDFDTSVTQLMASVKVEPAPNRVGQKIRNILLDNLNPLGQPSTPKYKLIITKIDKQETEQALRDDITATRIRVKYTAYYQLIDTQTNQQILQNDSVAYSSFDILSSPYSSTTSSIKTDNETAKIIADDISLRLGAYFHSTIEKNNDI